MRNQRNFRGQSGRPSRGGAKTKRYFTTSSGVGREGGVGIECVCGGGRTCRGWWYNEIIPANGNMDCSCCTQSDSTK